MKRLVIILFLIGISFGVSAECPCERKARKEALEDKIVSIEKSYEQEPSQEKLQTLAVLYDELEQFDET
jgi:hypothetical protein